MKEASLLALFLVGCFSVFSQPEPCVDDPPEMTSFCQDACIICDIDGFTGRHNGGSPSEAPEDFCTVVVHNAQWIAFIAGSEDLSVEIDVSNCQLGFGLEVGLYEGIGCTDFRRVSNCEGGTNTPIAPGAPRVISTTEPLVIGQYYYLVMDGAFGDNCDWTFTVLEGSTQVAPLEEAPLIEGPDNACPEVLASYTTPGLAGGTAFRWTLDGVEIGTTDSIAIDWPSAGLYQLCLSVSNACDEAPVSCRSIVVQSLFPTVFDEIICSGECFALNDTEELCEEGVFEFNYVTAQGCDSTVIVNLTVFESNETMLAATICEGDTLSVGNAPFFVGGTYTTTLENSLGCDSIVVLDLELIVCEIQGQATSTPVVCRGEASGRIDFFVINGTPPFSYTWQQFGGPASGSGTLANINLTETIGNLAAGTYLITINDNFGNDLILIQAVSEPETLTATLVKSNYNGFGLSCFGGEDGSVTAQPTGGVPPYNHSWSNGQSGMTITNLAAGDYTVDITDAAGCVITLATGLTEPSPLTLNADFSDPDCGGNDTGSASVTAVGGGVPPYLFSLNGGPFSEAQTFDNLSGGTYTLRVEDANGCTVSAESTLQERVIPVLNMPSDTSLELADQLTLRPLVDVPTDNPRWQPAGGLSCVDCLYPVLTATTTTTYTLSVTSLDGCTTVDSVTITVLDVRDVYVPNAFSPNNDGVNDALFVFGGPEVARIRSFRVFNRWGDLMYEAADVLPNTGQGAWDGRFGVKPLGNDVYVWTAEIEFIDGVVLDYGGDVLLLK